jgi:PAS domain S-box-containing protein
LIGLPFPALNAPVAAGGADPDSYIKRVMSGESVRYEAVHVTGGGAEIPVEISGHLVNADGQQYALKVIRDISEQKRAEAALRASNQQLQKIIEHLPFGMVVASDGGQTSEYLNDAFTTITGYGKEEVTTFATTIARLVPDPDQRAAVRGDVDEMIAEARRTGGPSPTHSYGVVRRDGSPRAVEVQFVGVGDLGIWTINDVTARVQAVIDVQGCPQRRQPNHRAGQDQSVALGGGL